MNHNVNVYGQYKEKAVTRHFPLPPHLFTGSCGTAIHLNVFRTESTCSKNVSKATNASPDRHAAESEADFIGLSW
jgi:hypothetical protein